jgi:hypothetical protein
LANSGMVRDSEASSPNPAGTLKVCAMAGAMRRLQIPISARCMRHYRHGLLWSKIKQDPMVAAAKFPA